MLEPMVAAQSGDAAAGASLGARYWRLWMSAGLSNLADGIFKVALPLVAVRFTRSPSLIAGLSVALSLPWLLFALQAGAIADRVDRRRAMLGANSVRALVLLLLAAAVATDLAVLWVLYMAAFCVGIAETIYDTSAQSILPQVVGRELLSRANGRLVAVELAANEFFGPPLGGVIVAAGAAYAFAGPAALWVAAIGVLLSVAGRFRVKRSHRTTFRADIAEGLRFLWRHQVLRTLAVMVGVYNFATNATFGVLVLYAVGRGSALGLNGAGYGLLLASTALGSVAGSFIAERVEQVLGRARALIVAIVGGTLLIAVLTMTTNVIGIGAGFFAGGASIAVYNVISVSLRQRVTPDRLLGRVNSAFRMVAWGTMPLGAAAGGLIAEALGLRAVFMIAAGLALSTLTGMFIVTDDRIAAGETAGEP